MSRGLEWVLKRLKTTQNARAGGVSKTVLTKKWSETGSGTKYVMNWQTHTVAVVRVTSNVWLKVLSTMAKCIRHREYTLPWGLIKFSESKCTNCALNTTLPLQKVKKIETTPLKCPIICFLKRSPTLIWQLFSMIFSGHTNRMLNVYRLMETTLMTLICVSPSRIWGNSTGGRQAWNFWPSVSLLAATSLNAIEISSQTLKTFRFVLKARCPNWTASITYRRTKRPAKFSIMCADTIKASMRG